MTILTAIMVGVIFASSTYMMLGRELKGVCMGVFLVGHGASTYRNRPLTLRKIQRKIRVW